MKKRPPKGPSNKTHGSGVHNEARTNRYVQVSMNIPVNKKGIPLHPEDCTPLSEEDLRKLLSSQIKSPPFTVEQLPSNVVMLDDRRNKLFEAFKEDINRFTPQVGAAKVAEVLAAYGADHNVTIPKQVQSIKAESYEEITELLQLEADQLHREVKAEDHAPTSSANDDERGLFNRLQQEVQTLYKWGAEIKKGTVRGSGNRTPFSGMLIHHVDCQLVLQSYWSKQGHYKKTSKEVPVEFGGYSHPYNPQRTTPNPNGKKGITPSGRPMAEFLEGGRYAPPETGVVCGLAPVLRWFINTVPSDRWPSNIHSYVVYRDDKPFVDSGTVNQAVAEGSGEKIKDIVLSAAIPYMTDVNKECDRLWQEVRMLEYQLAHQTGDFKSAEVIMEEMQGEYLSHDRAYTSTKSKPPEDVDELLNELNDFRIKTLVYPDEEAFGRLMYNDKTLGATIREKVGFKRNWKNISQLIKDVPSIIERNEKWDERRTIAHDPDKPYMELQRMGARQQESKNTYQTSSPFNTTHRHVLSVINEQLKPAPFGLMNPGLIACRGDGHVPMSPKCMLYTKDYMDELFERNCLPNNHDPDKLNSRTEFVSNDYMTNREKQSRDFWIRKGNADKAMHHYLINHTKLGRTVKSVAEGTLHSVNKTVDVLNMDVNPFNYIRKAWASKTQAKKLAEVERKRTEAVEKAESWAARAGFEITSKVSK